MYWPTSKLNPINWWRGLKHGLRSWWFWLPRLWTVRPWDWENLIEVIEHWLKWAERSFRSDKAMSVGSNKLADEIAYGQMLCRRILKEGNEPIFDGQDVQLFHDKEADDMTGCSKPWKFKDNSSEYCNWATRGWAKNELKETNAITMLSVHLKKHLQKWWD